MKLFSIFLWKVRKLMYVIQDMFHYLMNIFCFNNTKSKILDYFAVFFGLLYELVSKWSSKLSKYCIKIRKK